MLNTDMNALGNQSIPDLLINDDADGSRIDVENSASPAVVVLIGHSLVDGTIDHNINDIADLVGGKSFGDVDGAVLLESFSKLMSCSASLSVAVGHLWSLINPIFIINN